MAVENVHLTKGLKINIIAFTLISLISYSHLGFKDIKNAFERSVI